MRHHYLALLFLVLTLFEFSLTRRKNAVKHLKLISAVRSPTNITRQSSDVGDTDDGTKRTTQDQEKFEKWKQETLAFSAAFSKVMTHSLLLAGGPGHPFGIFTTMILYATGKIDGGGGVKKDIWAQIEDRVQLKVGKGAAERVIITANNEQKNIDQVMERGENFDRNDWNLIARKKWFYFAQENYDAAFDSRLITLPVGWITQMVAALKQLETCFKVPRCSVANELMHVRDDVIQLAREMFRKRYKAMIGTGFVKENTQCQGLSCSPAKWTYMLEDGVTGESWEMKKTDGETGINWGRFKDFRLETKKLIMQNLVKEVNPFFVEDICGPGCACPKKISAEDIEEVSLFTGSTCFGQPQVTDFPRCLTLCSNYGENKPFCGAESSIDGVYSGKRRCAKADWNNCRGTVPYSMHQATTYHDEDEPPKEFEIPDISELPEMGGSGESGDGDVDE